MDAGGDRDAEDCGWTGCAVSGGGAHERGVPRWRKSGQTSYPGVSALGAVQDQVGGISRQLLIAKSMYISSLLCHKYFITPIP